MVPYKLLNIRNKTIVVILKQYVLSEEIGFQECQLSFFLTSHYENVLERNMMLNVRKLILLTL